MEANDRTGARLQSQRTLDESLPRRIEDIIVTGKDRSIAIRQIDDRPVVERVHTRDLIPDADLGRRGLLVFREDVAIVEILPAGATALEHDQEFRRVALLGEDGVWRARNAERPVEGGTGIKRVLYPAFANRE